MLGQILKYINNWFVTKDGIHRGTFKIDSGKLVDVDFIKNGQYFRIVGSIFNDGVYKHEFKGLKDEIFNGEIWTLAIPNEIFELSEEIEDWVEKYTESINSPYQSESFGGYSYTKSSGLTGEDGKSSNPSWQSTFSSRLNMWRKI